VLRIEVSHLGVDVGIAFFSWIDTDMVRGTTTHHPAFARMRSEIRGPAGRTLPVSAAGAAIADAVAHRRRTVVAPRFVRIIYVLRGLIGPLVERDSRRRATTVDRATAELVADRGPFDAAMRPGDTGARTPAAAHERRRA